MESSATFHKFDAIVFYLFIKEEGQGKSESTSFSFCAFYPYAATVLFNEIFAKQKSQTAAGLTFGAASLEASVDSEQAVDDLRAHANAAVCNGYFYEIAFGKLC